MRGGGMECQPAATGNSNRYVLKVGPPPMYGVSTTDYQRDHRPPSWPPGTEYQYAYCSNYRPLLDAVHDQPRVTTCQIIPAERPRPVQDPPYKLTSPTHLPIIDKHYRGGVYRPDDPIGVQVPEEFSRRRDTLHGPIRLSCRDDVNNVYTPNYRYKDWIDRPLLEIAQEVENNILYCRVPEINTEYWDLYNEVRMARPRRKLRGEKLYQACGHIPLPIDKDIPNMLPTSDNNPHLGRFNNHVTATSGLVC